MSDAHLGMGTRTEEREKEARLIRFLDAVQKDGEQLFILGDLFDAWFEYRTVMPKGFHRILTRLEDLTRQGVIVHYLVGNHDCWIRDYFRDELGIHTHEDAFGTEINGRRIFLHHGDGLANHDTGYKILKKILRNRLSVWMYSWLHPDFGILLARSSSRTSRKYTTQKHYGEEDGMMQFARRKIDEGFDMVIMGHRHIPKMKMLGNGYYVNLGDWIVHNSYAELNGTQLELKHWTS
jgi:UDP-2,3-diacylglucosamine hydrolase